MYTSPRVGIFVIAMLWFGFSPVMAQALGPASAAVIYECGANVKCSITCLVDTEKVVQTGSPKTVTVTRLGRNNFLVELVEQGGHIQTVYHLAGTKILCDIDGLYKEGRRIIGPRDSFSVAIELPHHATRDVLFPNDNSECKSRHQMPERRAS